MLRKKWDVESNRVEGIAYAIFLEKHFFFARYTFYFLPYTVTLVGGVAHFLPFI